ncbi:hypothetical protein D9M69_506150 [compost metagenome]
MVNDRVLADFRQQVILRSRLFKGHTDLAKIASSNQSNAILAFLVQLSLIDQL